MTTINWAAGNVVAALMTTLDEFPPVVGLALLAMLTARALLFVMRVASNQPRLAAVKRSIRAALFEIRLFNHDLRAIVRAQGEILRHNLTYLRLSLVPMLWLLVPLGLLVAHLQPYYGYDGVAPGMTAVVSVRLADGWSGGGGNAGQPPALTLEAPPGIRIETPRVWTPSLNEASWRIAADRPGRYELIVRMQGEAATKTVLVSSGVALRSPVRPRAGALAQLRHPAEPPLPAGGPFEAIAVTYPERDIRVFGQNLDWMVVFFALTMVFAFALKRRFGVVM